MPTSRDTDFEPAPTRRRAHHRLRLLRAAGHRGLRRLRRQFLLGREPDDAVVIDADEARAMRMLERAGLVPTLRFSTRAGSGRRAGTGAGAPRTSAR